MKKTQNYMSGQRHFVFHGLTLLTIWFGLFACQPSTSNKADNEAFDINKDHFPDKVSIDHSLGFAVEYHKYYKVLHLFGHYNDVVDTTSYVLLQKGAPVPESGLPVIQVPIQKAVSMSTTHLGFYDLLDAYEVLKGVEVKQYISNPRIKEAVDAGAIAEVAPAGSLNVESVINMGADVVLGVGYPNSQNEAYQQLERTGIPVLLNADWQETNLLGRAEWVKLLAVLLNKEGLVNEKFGEIEREYERVLNLLPEQPEKPALTITGIALGDAWHVAGGKSFAYNLLRLVKADYPWKEDTSTGSLKLDFETVYEFGLKADYWIAPGSAKDKEGILQRDTRYADFKAFKTGNVFNIFGRYIEGGGNDYYESGVVSPHIILKDIVKIFHPDLLPDHQLVYHARLK